MILIASPAHQTGIRAGTHDTPQWCSDGDGDIGSADVQRAAGVCCLARVFGDEFGATARHGPMIQ
jgi:hypothetical protein